MHGTFLQKTTRDSSKCYTKSPTATTIVISHVLPSSPSWHKIQKQMEATSIYTELPIYYGTKEITTSS